MRSGKVSISLVKRKKNLKKKKGRKREKRN